MLAFHSEKNPLKRDEIASRRIHALQYQSKRERPIKLHQMKQMLRNEGSGMIRGQTEVSRFEQFLVQPPVDAICAVQL